MIEEEAQVIRVAEGQAWVEKAAAPPCSGCPSSCASARVAEAFDKAEFSFVVAAPFELHVGDRVILGVEEDALVKGSLAIYLLPLLGLFAGSIFSSILIAAWVPAAAQDIAAALGGILGLAAAFVALKRSRLLERNAPQPVVLRKAG